MVTSKFSGRHTFTVPLLYGFLAKFVSFSLCFFYHRTVLLATARESGKGIPENQRPCLEKLTELGLVEHVSRSKYVLARNLYAAAGKAGVHTRIVGLDKIQTKNCF